MGTTYLELSFIFTESIPKWSNNEVPSSDLKIYACPESKIKSNSAVAGIEFTCCRRCKLGFWGEVGGQAVLGRQFHHTTPWVT